ncbi:YybH family protein [Caenimonas aquaedulcis]|uniref:Nuclear transport factor 2 family protein n=1 Tax=Caenimonas aquaedulcis TaxID=2793270 RepID=A0A931H7B5_9BURK|nr:nuclear transport factor 2 family protein [Caenimonas aquaedulcis]MBG9390009.1 nuclear transport factor 2 family protein [Caenimonas aquaedulcis]
MKAFAVVATALALTACATRPLPTMPRDEAKLQVIATETAFAKTMADRDLKAFAGFIADDTVFFSGPTPLHGKQAVVAFWTRFYQKPEAPFSWAPEEVEVLEAGNLALSSGPVYDPKGKLIARFSSIWRLEAPGQWRIVFDKGGEVCDCAK